LLHLPEAAEVVKEEMPAHILEGVNNLADSIIVSESDLRNMLLEEGNCLPQQITVLSSFIDEQLVRQQAAIKPRGGAL
jgi:hypothetical protein